MLFPVIAAQAVVSMGIIQLLVIIVVLGVCLWLVQTYIPMAAPVKTLLTVVVVLIIVIFLLRAVGIF